MRKSTRNVGWTVGFLAILAISLNSCSKAGSTVTNSAVTYLSVIHGAPYCPPAAVYLNDTLITQSGGIATGAFSPKYGTIRPGFYSVKFKKAGTDSVFDQLGSSAYDTLNFYTLLLYNAATDSLRAPDGIRAHVLKIWDDFSSVTSANSYYRFFNLAPDYPHVNVYFNGVLTQSNRSPADNAANDGFNKFQPMAPANYTITVKNAATDSVIVTSPTIHLDAGNAYTFWISGLKTPNNSGISINVLQAQY